MVFNDGAENSLAVWQPDRKPYHPIGVAGVTERDLGQAFMVPFSVLSMDETLYCYHREDAKNHK